MDWGVAGEQQARQQALIARIRSCLAASQYSVRQAGDDNEADDAASGAATAAAAAAGGDDCSSSNPSASYPCTSCTQTGGSSQESTGGEALNPSTAELSDPSATASTTPATSPLKPRHAAAPASRRPGAHHPMLAGQFERRRRQLSRELSERALLKGGGGGAASSSSSPSGARASFHRVLDATAGVPLAKESKIKGVDVDEHCEASAEGLLQLVCNPPACEPGSAGAHAEPQSFEQMLDTLELAALYLWLGRNGSEAGQAQRRRAAAPPRPPTAPVAFR